MIHPGQFWAGTTLKKWSVFGWRQHNHPIHLHGHEFEVTGTDGGPVPKSARWPEVTTDVAVGQMRQIELIADERGVWAFLCH